MAELLTRLQDALADRYTIEREVGHGGMAVVFLAHDNKHHRPVAIKVLRPELAAAVGPERFLREIETAARLQHPHILPLLDSGEARGFLFYVMPYVEGESLRDRLTRNKQSPVGEALQIGREVADALDYAHRHDVVHRDIKPENILLQSGHAIVSDFGIARAITAAGGEHLTQTGIAIGTPAYMSPEQAVGEGPVDGRSDLYSLGCVLYEMLVGEPPHTASTAQAIIAKRLTEPVSPLRGVRDAIPEALEGAILRALAKVPADRYDTAAEFAEALGRSGVGRQTVARSVGPGRVATLYLVSSLAVLGVVQLLVNQLGLPVWVVPGAIVLLLVGFPIILVTALAQRGAVPVPQGVSHWLTWRKAILGGALAFGTLGIAVTVYMVARARAPGAARSESGRKMLAVLPFENLGRPEDEYFADGMTEELTARLAGIRSLGVIGRTSAVQYKKTSKAIPQIGKELGVEYVLEGTVRWEKASHGPSRVRVTPQLIRVSDASHVWARIYDATMADVFQVQSNIATQVAETLDVTLLGPERKSLATKPTENLEAYDYYLRGKDYETRFYVEADAQLAVRMYQRAVQLDPQFVLAYAALARAHLLLSWLFGRTDELRGAKEALDRAQQLGPALPETHLALGYYDYYGSRDYDRALEQFAWVRERQPDDPDVISAIGFIHRRQGRWVEAVSDLTRATELDPRNHSVFLNLGETYGSLLRRYPEASRALGRAISLAPDVPTYQSARAYLYLMQDGNTTRATQVLRQAGSTADPARILVAYRLYYRVLVRVFAADYGEALAHLPLRAAGGDTAGYYLAKAEYYGLTSDTPRADASFDSARVVLEAKLAARPANKASEQWPVETRLALAYAGLGRKADAIRLGREGAQLVPVSRDAFAAPFVLLDLAEIYVRAGEYDAALDQLEYLLSIPSPVSIPLLRVDPLYAPLRGNPRFERLVRGTS